MYETLQLERDSRGVATLTLARPEKHNVLNAMMISELSDVAQALANDADTRVVVLAGQGRSFCAGADLGWMRAQTEMDVMTRESEARKLANMLRALDQVPQVLIGRIHGNAFGGGVGMTAVCDIAIAAEETKFALTETRLGLTPATISPYVVARIGAGRARECFLTARPFDAARAARHGLIARSVPEELLDAEIEAEVAASLEAAPGAIAAAKELIRSLAPPIDTAVQNMTISALSARWESAEVKEGIAAFFEKRPPFWR